MPDRQEVIRGLECIAGKKRSCEGCPYSIPVTPDLGGFSYGYCAKGNAAKDAIALLNGQTAQWIWDRPHHFRCSGCNGVVGQRTYLYCPNCGREMLLSETERSKEWPEEVHE